MTRNAPSRHSVRRADAGNVHRAIPYEAHPQVHHVLQAKRALAMLSLLAALCVVFSAIASAEPAAASAPAVTKPAATAPATASAVAIPMSQEALLQHLALHPDHLYVLDVRTPQEYAAGHVPGAVNVPYDQLASRLAEVPKDKDVVLYCKSGRRAGLAADVLAKNGYQRLSHLEGDMNAWIEKGRPVVKP